MKPVSVSNYSAMLLYSPIFFRGHGFLSS